LEILSTAMQTFGRARISWSCAEAKRIDYHSNKRWAIWSPNPKKQFISMLFFFWWYWDLNSGPTSWATLPALLWWVFSDRVSRAICLGWLRTAILLISASWVARIIGVSHWCPASIHLFFAQIKALPFPASRTRPTPQITTTSQNLADPMNTSSSYQNLNHYKTQQMWRIYLSSTLCSWCA
jgi:hypothetical protein